ncbi:MAG TPA: DMT family transporter [Pseudolabrys sp.]|nr:DMT family transporter [Pseudolabrys sp.]
MDLRAQPAAARPSGILIGVLCGIGAALGWAAGFVAAKHGVTIGFSPADLALHRFLWSGLLLMPLVLRDGITDLGGIGWGRGLVMSVLSGPPQAMIAYTGFMLVPLGHGTTIQPACAALSGLILATLVLGERPTGQRIIGGTTIIAGLLVFGVESITTIGSHGVGGDLLFATAGLFWATFGILLRYWRVSGTRAVAAVGALSVVVFAPLHALLVGYGGILRMGLAENLLQVVVQGILAGLLPIYLFARAVILLGAGRAATFPALVPGFSMIIGYLALGVVPSIPQIVGLVIVVIGFRFALR